MIGCREFHFVLPVAFRVGSGFEPCLGCAEVAWEFLAKTLVVFRGVGAGLSSKVMAVYVGEAGEKVVTLLLAKFLLEELLTTLSGLAALFQG